MTDNDTQNADTPPATANAGNQQGPMSILAQYVKDLSFENPHAPDTLRPNQPTPDMNINVGLSVNKISEEDSVYEVLMHVEARATRKIEGQAEQVVFVVELEYAVLAGVDKVPERQHHPVLMIEVPKLAFPFARQILADTTSQGGYPPVLLNPVDFEGLYIQQYQDQQNKEKAAK